MRNHKWATGRLATLRLVILAVGVLGLASGPVPAEEAERPETDELRRQLDARAQEAKERLQLTEEQEEQMRPVLEESLARRRAVQEKYGVGQGQRPGRRQIRPLRKEMQQIQQDTEEKLAEILSEAQMEEYRKLHLEWQEEMREEMRRRREGGG